MPPRGLLPTAMLYRRSFSAAPSRPWRGIQCRGVRTGSQGCLPGQQAATVNEGLGSAIASTRPPYSAVTRVGIGWISRSCICAMCRRSASPRGHSRLRSFGAGAGRQWREPQRRGAGGPQGRGRFTEVPSRAGGRHSRPGAELCECGSSSDSRRRSSRGSLVEGAAAVK
jgi:hypothetical protein